MIVINGRLLKPGNTIYLAFKMKTLLIILLFVSTTKLSLSAIGATVQYYYWRDYTGIVPNDAIAGGVDSHGRTTYVAQISVPAIQDPTRLRVEAIPAVLQAEKMSVYAPYNGNVISTNASSTSVKVLCAPNSIHFIWHTPSTTLPHDHSYVIVGYESLSPVFLGRAQINNETITGKLNANNGYRVLEVAHNGSSVYMETYTILTYTG
ncbi:hypothetical protein PPYR_13743 [Photinus pyralis]|uniref:Uncharacterized protein n=2 Tax=Photinus pyralis TaxID=7054 RepID=A0A5N4A9Y1_PHOPY|nr:uncharacterized protein LOC116179072 [Photinus pyralis]KAB0794123.1 hypothetical protein PPYR_13743 [Photinus pyralis]